MIKAHDTQQRILSRGNQGSTHSFANTPLKAAQAPLATAKKIHWERMLQEAGPPTRRPSSPLVIFSDGGLSGSLGGAGGCFLRWRTMADGRFGMRLLGEDNELMEPKAGPRSSVGG